MNNFWVFDCDSDSRHVTLYTKNVIFMTSNGVSNFNFSYGTPLDKNIISATLIVDEIEGDVFSPYLAVIGAKGLFVNEQIAKLLSIDKSVEVIPLTIIHNEQIIEGDWFYCNPTVVLDIIDWGKSEVTLSTGGRILFVDNLVFKEWDNDFPTIFRADGFLSMIFIRDVLRGKLSELKFSGFKITNLEEFER